VRKCADPSADIREKIADPQEKELPVHAPQTQPGPLHIELGLPDPERRDEGSAMC